MHQMFLKAKPELSYSCAGSSKECIYCEEVHYAGNAVDVFIPLLFNGSNDSFVCHNNWSVNY